MAHQGKIAAATQALAYVEEGKILGVGTGSTVNCLIEQLKPMKDKIPGAVSSSEQSTALLKEIGIPVLDLNEVDEIGIYIDGADEIDKNMHLIKGGGGALTREKIIAAVADTFICIADASKEVDVLGGFPLPVEVIPMARNYVASQLSQWGEPKWRKGFITDNGNIILDLHGVQFEDAIHWEEKINHITGVVTNGLFAKRAPEVALIGEEDGRVTKSEKNNI